MHPAVPTEQTKDQVGSGSQPTKRGCALKTEDHERIAAEVCLCCRNNSPCYTGLQNFYSLCDVCFCPPAKHVINSGKSLTCRLHTT